MIVFVSDSLPCPQFNDGATLRVHNLLKVMASQYDLIYIYVGTEPIDEHKSETIKFCDELGIDTKFYTRTIGLRGKLLRLFGIRERGDEPLLTYLSGLQLSDVLFMEGLYSFFLSKYFKTQAVVIASAVDCLSLASKRQFKIPRMGFTYYVKHALRFLQRYLLERRLVSNFKCIFFVASDDAEFAKRHYGCDVAVVPNGVDASFFAPSVLETSNFDFDQLLFTGVLNSSMNENAALLSIEAAKNFDIRLIIAGRSPQDKLKNSLAKGITLVENPLDIRVAFKKPSFFVCPIMFGTGIKNNVLQAMAMGFPCIVSKLIADPIGIRHGVNGLVFETIEEFFDLVQKRKLVEVEKIRLNSRAYIVEEFSWEAQVKKYLTYAKS